MSNQLWAKLAFLMVLVVFSLGVSVGGAYLLTGQMHEIGWVSYESFNAAWICLGLFIQAASVALSSYLPSLILNSTQGAKQ